MLRAGSSFLKYRTIPFLKPGILAAHDCLNKAIHGGVFLCPRILFSGEEGKMHTILHFLTEVGSEFVDAWLGTHFRLRRIPDDCGHRKEREAVIDQILKAGFAYCAGPACGEASH